MNTWLMVLVGLIYIAICVNYMITKQYGQALCFFSYTLGIAGMWLIGKT